MAGTSGWGSLTPLEQDVFHEINVARTQPAMYAEHVAAERRHVKDGYLSRPQEVPIRLNEGSSAYDEAISALQAQAPLAALGSAPLGMVKAAKAHATDLAPGRSGHTGSDGSSSSDRLNRFGRWSGTCLECISYGNASARNIVVSLLVDDGVPSRGHRHNLLSPAASACGVGCGQHATYKSCCVITLAGGYADTGAADDPLATAGHHPAAPPPSQNLHPASHPAMSPLGAALERQLSDTAGAGPATSRQADIERYLQGERDAMRGGGAPARGVVVHGNDGRVLTLSPTRGGVGAGAGGAAAPPAAAASAYATPHCTGGTPRAPANPAPWEVTSRVDEIKSAAREPRWAHVAQSRMAAAAHPAPPPTETALEKGVRVRTVGLTRNSDFNDKAGTVVAVEHEMGAFRVMLDGEQFPRLMLPQNLYVAPGLPDFTGQFQPEWGTPASPPHRPHPPSAPRPEQTGWGPPPQRHPGSTASVPPAPVSPRPAAAPPQPEVQHLVSSPMAGGESDVAQRDSVQSATDAVSARVAEIMDRARQRRVGVGATSPPRRGGAAGIPSAEQLLSSPEAQHPPAPHSTPLPHEMRQEAGVPSLTFPMPAHSGGAPAGAAAAQPPTPLGQRYPSPQHQPYGVDPQQGYPGMVRKPSVRFESIASSIPATVPNSLSQGGAAEELGDMRRALLDAQERERLVKLEVEMLRASAGGRAGGAPMLHSIATSPVQQPQPPAAAPHSAHSPRPASPPAPLAQQQQQQPFYDGVAVPLNSSVDLLVPRAPQCLMVHVGSEFGSLYAELSGSYLLQQEELFGNPVWRQRQGEGWVYCSRAGLWTLCDDRQHFADGSGFAATRAANNGRPPSAFRRGDWNVLSDDDEWRCDSMFHVTSQPAALLRCAPGGGAAHVTLCLRDDRPLTPADPSVAIDTTYHPDQRPTRRAITVTVSPGQTVPILHGHVSHQSIESAGVTMAGPGLGSPRHSGAVSRPRDAPYAAFEPPREASVPLSLGDAAVFPKSGMSESVPTPYWHGDSYDDGLPRSPLASRQQALSSGISLL